MLPSVENRMSRLPLSALIALAILPGVAAMAQTSVQQVTFLGTNPAVVAQPPVGASAISSFGVDAAGNCYYSASGSLIEVAANGTRTTLASGLKQAEIAVDYAGDVFIADTGNNRVLSIAAGGKPVVRASVKAPSSITADVVDDFFYLTGGALYEVIRNGEPRKIGSFPGAVQLAYGPATGEDDTIYILSASGSKYSVSTYVYHNEGGTIYAGQNFTAAERIDSFVVDGMGNLVFSAGSGANTYVFQVAPSGQQEVLTQIPAGLAPGLAVDRLRNVYYVDGSGTNQVMKGTVNFGSVVYDGRGTETQAIDLNFSVPTGVTLSGERFGSSAFFDYDAPPPGDCSPGVTECTVNVTYTPSGTYGVDGGLFQLTDPSGNLLGAVPMYGRGVVDYVNLYTVGVPRTSSGLRASPSPSGISNANGLVVTDPGAGTVGGMGGFIEPETVAIAPDGTEYVTQAGKAGVVEISPDGTQSLIAQRLVTEPNGVAVDDAGELFISDRDSIFRLGLDGTETALAVPAADGGYEEAESITADAGANVYAFFGRGGPSGKGGLVEINPAGGVTPIAVPATVKSATGLGVDDGGGLYISDGLTRTLSSVRTDGSSFPIITALKEPKGVKGSGGPIVADEAASMLYAPIAVQYNSYSLLSGTYSGSSTLDFGSVPIGSSVTKIFQAINQGTGEGGVSFQLGPATGGKATDFTFTPVNGASIVPGGSAMVTITYTPTTAGPNSVVLYGGTAFEYSGDYENFVYLTGTGVAAKK